MAEHQVTVRWHDGYIEEFDAVAVRVGASFVWLKLRSGPDRWLPTEQIRWFSLSPESRAGTGQKATGMRALAEMSDEELRQEGARRERVHRLMEEGHAAERAKQPSRVMRNKAKGKGKGA